MYKDLKNKNLIESPAGINIYRANDIHDPLLIKMLQVNIKCWYVLPSVQVSLHAFFTDISNSDHAP